MNHKYYRRLRPWPSPCEYRRQRIPLYLFLAILFGQLGYVVKKSGLSRRDGSISVPRQLTPLQASIAYELLYRCFVREVFRVPEIAFHGNSEEKVVLWNTPDEWLCRTVLLQKGRIPEGAVVAYGSQSHAHVHHFMQLEWDDQYGEHLLFDNPDDPMLLKPGADKSAVPPSIARAVGKVGTAVLSADSNIAFPMGTFRYLWGCGCGTRVITSHHALV